MEPGMVWLAWVREDICRASVCINCLLIVGRLKSVRYGTCLSPPLYSLWSVFFLHKISSGYSAFELDEPELLVLKQACVLVGICSLDTVKYRHIASMKVIQNRLWHLVTWIEPISTNSPSWLCYLEKPRSPCVLDHLHLIKLALKCPLEATFRLL